MFSQHETVNPKIRTALLKGEVPTEWVSNDNFINACDMTANWTAQLLECWAQTVITQSPGADKKENKDFYAFSMEPKFELSRSLQEGGWEQYNLTIRLGGLEGRKKKASHYTFHFWAMPSPSGIDYSKIILLKLKLEGKFVPSSPEESQMIVDLAKQFLDA